MPSPSSPASAPPTWRPDFGREKRPFKADVRKLKELGLTESLQTGYRVSPRGRAVLKSEDRQDSA